MLQTIQVFIANNDYDLVCMIVRVYFIQYLTVLSCIALITNINYLNNNNRVIRHPRERGIIIIVELTIRKLDKDFKIWLEQPRHDLMAVSGQQRLGLLQQYLSRPPQCKQQMHAQLNGWNVSLYCKHCNSLLDYTSNVS